MTDFDGIPLPDRFELDAAIDQIEASGVQPATVAMLKGIVAGRSERKPGAVTFVVARNSLTFYAFVRRRGLGLAQVHFRYLATPHDLLGVSRPDVILIQGCERYPNWPEIRESLIACRAWVTVEPNLRPSPGLASESQYLDALGSMPPRMRSSLMNGDWGNSPDPGDSVVIDPRDLMPPRWPDGTLVDDATISDGFWRSAHDMQFEAAPDPPDEPCRG